MVPVGMGRKGRDDAEEIRNLEGSRVAAGLGEAPATCDVRVLRLRSTTYGYPCAPEQTQNKQENLLIKNCSHNLKRIQTYKETLSRKQSVMETGIRSGKSV